MLVLAFLSIVLGPDHVIRDAWAQDTGATFRNELILAPILEKTRLESDILGFQQGQRIFLSLTELTGLLQFPISVDASAGLAGGWFISEERSFSFDSQALSVTVGDSTMNVKPDAFVIESSDIFVDTSTLEQWFPLRLNTDLQQLALEIETLETLPIEAQLARSSRKIKPAFTTRAPELPLQQSAYQFLGHRATDLRVSMASSRIDEDADTKRRFTGSLLSKGDLAWMTSTIYVSGNEDRVSDARFTLERSRFDGFFGLNHVEMGDVLNTIGSGSLGIGIRGGTAKMSADNRYSDEFIDLEGDILPGWQAELYRNGVLIDFQEVGSDGRYAFVDVPLVFGENTFEFVFYGPFGETRREKVTHFVGLGVLGAGSAAYEFSATQAGRSVFDVRSVDSTSADPDSPIYSGKFNLGITRFISAGIFARSYEQDEERLTDYSASLNLNTAWFQLRGGYNANERSPNQISGSLSTRIKAVGLNLRYTEFSDKDLEPQFISVNPQLWSASLSASVAAAPLPFTLSTSFTKREVQESAAGVISTTHTFSDASRLSSAVSYSWADSREDGGTLDRFSTANISASTIASPWVFRADYARQIYPESEPIRLGGSANLRVGDDMSVDFSIEKNYTNGITRYRAGYSWDFPEFRISPQVVYGDDERYIGLITISTNIATRPDTTMPLIDRLSLANSGGVVARAFLDDNGDGRLNAGERPLDDIEFRAIQSFRKARTDEQGRAYIERLPTYRQTDIALDVSTLFDADMTPSSEGNSVIPRPGHWHIVDYPVVLTSVLEGVVMELKSDGTEVPMAGVIVQLFSANGDVLSSQRTPYDGQFLFDRVQPGTYELKLTEAMNDRLIRSPNRFKVNSGTERLTGLKFEIAEEEATDSIFPIFLAQPGAASVVPADPPSQPLEQPLERQSVDTVVESDIPAIPVQPAPEPAIEAVSSAPVPEPVVETVLPAPAAAPESVLPVIASNRPVSNEGWLVQLGAFRARENAERAWAQARASSPFLLPLSANIQRSGALFRLYAGKATSEEAARLLCEQLKEDNVDCLVIERP